MTNVKGRILQCGKLSLRLNGKVNKDLKINLFKTSILETLTINIKDNNIETRHVILECSTFDFIDQKSESYILHTITHKGTR